MVAVLLLGLGLSVVLPLRLRGGGASTPNGEQPAVAPPSVEDAAAAMAAAAADEPVDFDAALEAARQRMRTGGSRHAALAAASEVLSGQLRGPASPTAIGGTALREGWLAEGDARLLQHEAVTAPDWMVIPSEPRRLSLRAPLPPWADDVAERLGPAVFNGAAPDGCLLYACEPGQEIDPLLLSGKADHGGDGDGDGDGEGDGEGDASDGDRTRQPRTTALLLLHGRGSLHCYDAASDVETRCALSPRDLLELGPDAHRASASYRLTAAEERLIVLVFRQEHALGS